MLLLHFPRLSALFTFTRTLFCHVTFACCIGFWMAVVVALLTAL